MTPQGLSAYFSPDYHPTFASYRTPVSHVKLSSTFCLHISQFSFTETTEYIYFSLILSVGELQYKKCVTYCTIGNYQWPHSKFLKHIYYTSSYSWSATVRFLHSWGPLDFLYLTQGLPKFSIHFSKAFITSVRKYETYYSLLHLECHLISTSNLNFLVSIQRNVAKETKRTRSSIEM